MRKSNSKVLKKPNKRSAKENWTNGSVPSKKAKNASKIRSEKFADPKKSSKNLKKSDPFFNEPRYQQILEKGLEQKNTGAYRACALTLKKLVREFPDSPNANWLLAALLFVELKKTRAAIPYFEKAVELNPASERSSLGLFHCLWSTNQLDAALEEMKRYQRLTNWASQDYLEIMADIKEKGKPDE